MPRTKLTKTTVERISPPAHGVQFHRDTELKGFALRVTSGGTKSWIYERRIAGKPRRLTLGQYPDLNAEPARKRAEQLAGQLADGLDIYAESQRIRSEARRMPTVKEFAAEYISRYAKPNKKSWREDERLLEREVVPVLGKLRLDQVHRRDIIALLDAIEDRDAPVARNRTLAVVRKMFAFAIERGVLESTPVLHIKQLREETRERVLTDDEIRHLWLSTSPEASGTHPVLKQALRLLLLTGARATEVCGLRWNEVDLDAATWTLPADRSKNGLSHTVPLAKPALAILREAQSTAEAQEHEAEDAPQRVHVFTARQNKPLTRWGVTQAMARLFPTDEHPRPHDIRRTVGTRLGALGFNRLIVDKVLNHKDRTVGGIYDRHSYDAEKRRALQAWARELERITGVRRKQSKVASLNLV